MVFCVLSRRQKKKYEGSSLNGLYATAHIFSQNNSVISVNAVSISAEEKISLSPLNILDF